MHRQKDIERGFLDEARRAATDLFPAGEFEASERPDFLHSAQSLGIELTELCESNERALGRRLDYVMPEAKRLYETRPDATPVWVNFGLLPDGRRMHVKELGAALGEFVYEHRYSHGNYFWDKAALPTGFFHIGIWPPNGSNTWFHSAVRETKLVGPELVQAFITDKNALLADYRKAAAEVWLLIIDNLFLGAGEVCVDKRTIVTHTFEFGFDKVLLFERQPGGSGKIFDLHGNVPRAAEQPLT